MHTELKGRWWLVGWLLAPVILSAGEPALLPGTSGAEALSSSPPPALSTNALPWAPPKPAPDDFDWIQLKSGEWLKGRIKALQDKELEFDSEEMDLQTFDWSDVHQVRSSRLNQVLLEDRTTAIGTLLITRDRVIVGGAEPQSFPRSRLQALTPYGKHRWNYWSGKISAGLSLRSGNTHQTEFNSSANLQRRTPATRFRIDYLGNVSEVEGEQTANNHRASLFLDIWLSRRLFLRVPWTEYYHDPLQNIAHRATAGLGVGYDLIDNERIEWNVVLGPAYQRTWFDSVQPGEAQSRGTAAMVFGSHADIELTQRTDLILEYRGQYTSRETGETTHHSEVTLELELTKVLDLDATFIWDRVAQPEPSADGTVPKPDDYRLILKLGVDF